jgi:hypothetical protein
MRFLIFNIVSIALRCVLLLHTRPVCMSLNFRSFRSLCLSAVLSAVKAVLSFFKMCFGDGDTSLYKCYQNMSLL